MMFQEVRNRINNMAVISEILEYLESLSSLTVPDSENLVKFLFINFLPKLEKHLAKATDVAESELLAKTSKVLCGLLATVRQHDLLQFVMLIQYLLQTEAPPGDSLIMTDAMRTRQEIVGRLYVDIYSQVFSAEWPIELILNHQAVVTADVLFRIVFNLRDQFVACIRFCPQVFIEQRYFEHVLGVLLGPQYLRITDRSILLEKIAILNKIQHITEALLTPELQKDIQASHYKDKYMCAFIKRQIKFDSTLISLEGDRQSLRQVEKQVLNYKNGTKQVADFFVDHIVLTSPNELVEDIVDRLMAIWGCQRSFIQIASINQQLYVTYMIYKVIMVKSSASIYDARSISDNLQTGVQYRIGSGETPKLVQEMGLLIWKQYALLNGISFQDPEDEGDETVIPFEDITAERVFDAMDAVPLNSTIKIQEHNRQELNEQQSEQESQKEMDVSPKELPQPSFYTANDSDNDSDFSLKYEQQEDDFSDVQKTVLPQRPLYIQDLILGLQSDDHDRYTIAVDCMAELITNQNSNDLDVMCSDLIQNMFRATNKFEEADFLAKKYKAIVALVVQQPKQASHEIVQRILDSETSLGEKAMLVECLPNAAVELSNLNIEQAKSQPGEKKLTLQDKIKQQQKIDNEFFGIHSLFDEEQKQVGTVIKESRSLQTKSQKQKAQKNEFYPHAEAFVYQMVHLMGRSEVLSQPLLAGRVLCALSVVLDAAQNHWRILAIIHDIFEMFLRLKDLVNSQYLYRKALGSEQDALSQTQSQFKIGLATCLSKTCQHLTSKQKQVAQDWLAEQIEMYGGDETFQSQEVVNVKEVCMLVTQMMSAS